MNAPDPPPASRLHLHAPIPGAVVRLVAIPAKPFGASADDIDRNRVLHRPYSCLVLPRPAQEHLLGKARRRKNPQIDIDPVARPRHEVLVSVQPDAPVRALVLQAIALRSSLDAVI